MLDLALEDLTLKPNLLNMVRHVVKIDCDGAGFHEVDALDADLRVVLLGVVDEVRGLL